MNWFRMKPEKQPDQPESMTPGGSRLIRHSGDECSKPNFGVLGGESLAFAKKREAIYDDFFGTSDNIYHETLPLIPHLDIYQYGPGHAQRDFWTLVTSGMSDLRMPRPNDVPVDFARTELVFYCDEPKQDYLELLRRLAHFPHDNRTWLGPGHTMPNGNPASPIFSFTPHLDTVLFIPTILPPDNELAQRLVLDGDCVNFLWVVPITAAECDFKLQNGIDAVYDLLDTAQHPFVFRGDRSSYV